MISKTKCVSKLIVFNKKRNWERFWWFWWFLKKKIGYESQSLELFDTFPLHQFTKLNNFLWNLGKNLSNFVSPLENLTTCITIIVHCQIYWSLFFRARRFWSLVVEMAVFSKSFWNCPKAKFQPLLQWWKLMKWLWLHVQNSCQAYVANTLERKTGKDQTTKLSMDVPFNSWRIVR